MLEISGRMGRYVVESELGQGGVGLVYRGRCITRGGAVAIKILRDTNPDEDTRRRFEQEAALGASFQHPNFVRVIDTGRYGARPFFIMELVEGENLERLLSRGALSLAMSVRLVAKLARALDAAHRHGIVHRDVKPANVIVKPDGEPVLMDFGFAKDLERQADVTRDYVVGTPSYMAPEQVRQRPVTGKVDIWALGVVLYLMTTRRLPFEGASFQETFENIMEREPAPPSRFASSVGKELERIILRCLRKDPAARFVNGADLAKALDAWLALPEGERGARWPVALLAVVGGTVVAIALVVTLGVFFAKRSAPRPPVESLPAPPPTSPPTPTPPPPPPPPAVRGPSDEEILARSDAALGELDVLGAVAILESAVTTRSPSARVQRAYARALAFAGRASDARAAARDARRIDPLSAAAFDGDEELNLDHAPATPEAPPDGWGPPSAVWRPLYGGAWGEKDGVLLGADLGTGPFNFAGRVRQDAGRLDKYEVSVEIALGSSYAYAGIIFGARSAEDFLAAYIFYDESAIRRGMPKEAIAEFRTKYGCFPKVIRCARIQEGRWQFVNQALIAFPDEGYTPLTISCSGGSTAKITAGDYSSDFTFDRTLEGHVGILKYYDTVARFRNWRCTPR